jgi:hypothetical protein
MPISPKAMTFDWEMGMDMLNDMDLSFHASDSGREETSSSANLFNPYPKQATEQEVPPLTVR